MSDVFESMLCRPATDMADEPADERLDDIMQYAVDYLSGHEQRISSRCASPKAAAASHRQPPG